MSDDLKRLTNACRDILSLSDPSDFVSNGEWRRAVAGLDAALVPFRAPAARTPEAIAAPPRCPACGLFMRLLPEDPGWAFCDPCRAGHFNEKRRAPAARTEGTPCRGSDLHCELCGSSPRDVAPDYAFDPTREAIRWTCCDGHTQITGWRPVASPDPKETKT